MYIACPMPRRLEAHTVRLDSSRARDRLGSRMEISSAMIATTTSSSMRVKAFDRFFTRWTPFCTTMISVPQHATRIHDMLVHGYISPRALLQWAAHICSPTFPSALLAQCMFAHACCRVKYPPPRVPVVLRGTGHFQNSVQVCPSPQGEGLHGDVQSQPAQSRKLSADVFLFK